MNTNNNLFLYDISHIGDYNSLFKNDYKRLNSTSSQYQKSSNPESIHENDSSILFPNAKNDTSKISPHAYTDEYYEATYPHIEMAFGDQQETYFTKEFEKAEKAHDSNNKAFRNEYLKRIHNSSILPDFNHGTSMRVTGTSHKIDNKDSMKKASFINEKIPLSLAFKQDLKLNSNTEFKCQLAEICQKIQKKNSMMSTKSAVENVKSFSIDSNHSLASKSIPNKPEKKLSLSLSLPESELSKCDSNLTQSACQSLATLPDKCRISAFDYGDSSDESPNRQTESEFLASAFFVRSNFANVPPTIRFSNNRVEVEEKFKKYLRRLKWKLTTVTPTVVRHCVLQTNFTLTNNSKQWIGTWAKNIKAHQYKSIEDFQKFNHFPMSYQIGRKDCLYRNMNRMAATFGAEEFNFLPKSFILPPDMRKLEKLWGGNKLKWIIKPSASAKGKGIRVINQWRDVPKGQTCVVQKYITNPLLINKSKFDLRIYVYITCFHPLRAYISPDGLVRFATANYSNKSRSLKNNFIHLTNYSLNRKNSSYRSSSKPSVTTGDDDPNNHVEPHKWSLQALWTYLKKNYSVNTANIWNEIKDLTIKTIVTGERAIGTMVNLYANNQYCCHELFGFDVLLDESFKLWLLEVNISPSLHTKSQLDKKVKSSLVVDVLNTAGYRMPDLSHLRPNKITDHAPQRPLPVFCMDKRLHQKAMAADEKDKQIYFSLLHTENQTLTPSILESLTPCDVRVLVESVDERSRCGRLEILFPTLETGRYLKYLEGAKYYSLLLHAWLIKYQNNASAGMKALNELCLQDFHLDRRVNSNRQKWKAPSQEKKP